MMGSTRYLRVPNSAKLSNILLEHLECKTFEYYIESNCCLHSFCSRTNRIENITRFSESGQKSIVHIDDLFEKFFDAVCGI